MQVFIGKLQQTCEKSTTADFKYLEKSWILMTDVNNI